MILTTAYLPPVWYLEFIKCNEEFKVEVYEHFVKQTIRNRSHILSPNGIQTLIIPVVHNNRTNTPIKDIRISNDHPWQRQHWRSLNAAYRRSAFFEFYMDEFEPFYHKNYEFLIDFNNGLMDVILNSLKLKRQITFTDSYNSILPEIETDFRKFSDTGLPFVLKGSKNYPQVFGYKNGFVGGLSSVDLLFNMGTAANDYLSDHKLTNQ